MERTKTVCNAHQGRERDAPAKPGWSCCLLILNNSVSLEDMTGKVLKKYLVQVTLSPLLSPC